VLAATVRSPTDVMGEGTGSGVVAGVGTPVVGGCKVEFCMASIAAAAVHVSKDVWCHISRRRMARLSRVSNMS